jgi:hypothetical protein
MLNINTMNVLKLIQKWYKMINNKYIDYILIML